MNKYDVEKQCRQLLYESGVPRECVRVQYEAKRGRRRRFQNRNLSETHSPIHSPARLVASTAEYPTHPQLSKSPRYRLVRHDEITP